MTHALVREQHVVERLLHLLLVDRVQRTRRLAEQPDIIITRTSHYESFNMSGTGYILN